MLARDAAYAAGLLASSPLWGASLLRTGKWRTDWAGRFGRGPSGETLENAGGPRILFCAVSVGEVNALRGLVDALRSGPEPCGLVLAVTTNTGVDRAQQLYGGREGVAVVRYPLDFSWAVGRFLDAIRPDLVATVELELWPNFVAAARLRGVPVAIVNGRLSERSFRRYRLARPLVRSAFAAVAAAGVQTQAYGRRFVALGTPAERVRVLDTMKWDNAVVRAKAGVPGAAELAEAMGIDRDRPLVVAGSTGPGEPAFLLRGRPRDAQLLIAPRKPEHFAAAAAACAADGAGFGRRSTAVRGTSGVFLLDTIGELGRAYALADVAIVGRSFLGDLYGSDAMEPAALGVPTMIGPHHKDFAETVAIMRNAGGLLVTDDPASTTAELLANPTLAAEVAAAGQAVILAHQGATARHARMLRDLLPPAAGGTD
ncbi:3-deoxy-D-manno-octulosonic acid transferase [Phycisphaera mikurensis]|uniref:3-deoxy-D-manno-octulosonic acid transferase n=1 Tax=Phycisphaera mikurensis (strain NBRC 102666 / KCTC 22515 / FYK2301M01) TaxID=1142394 RepID=I0IEG7_PHYMF|nr:glycosyltransferase N-terminal domain-containing protein [Phycisphaera mikurensis]MBB6441454.1 3-deoxy-D-manno-octulosonic-acid transferase [Phycisphaera mikurensis]BAM03655.1 3-deoxy-D-manno-octulosonic-acid transferase [Phycisphaera mikurensis NBRC 102666]